MSWDEVSVFLLMLSDMVLVIKGVGIVIFMECFLLFIYRVLLNRLVVCCFEI